MSSTLDEQRAGLRSGLTSALEACIDLDEAGFVEPSNGAHLSPVFLYFHPYAKSNPYQDLLYCRALELGFSSTPLLNLREAEAFRWPGLMVLHLHWLNKVLDGCEALDEVRRSIDEFMARVRRLKLLGYHIVWSVHNVHPHDAKHPEYEALLNQKIADEVDTIHVLNMYTLDETEAHYSIDPNKVVYSPIPSYSGVYPNSTNVIQAREALGLSMSDVVFLLFGSLKRYKGTIEFVEAIDALRDRGSQQNIKVIIAGPPADEALHEEIVARCSMRDYVLLLAEHVSDDDVQTLMHATDFVACPYSKFLNSSVAMVALTFKKRVIAPHRGGFAELSDSFPNALLTYSPDDPLGLCNALEQAVARPNCNDGAFESLDQYSPDRISELFLSAIRTRLTSGASMACEI